jgi:hypothetical protein
MESRAQSARLLFRKRIAFSGKCAMSIGADDEFRGPACGRRPKAALFFKIALSLLLTYVCFRSAFSVARLTYASIGKPALILVLSGSLVYFGTLLAIGKWVGRAPTMASRTAYWNGGLIYLPLAVSAVFIKIFMAHTRIESSVYPIQMLLLILLYNNVFGYKSKFFPELWNRYIGPTAANSTRSQLNAAPAMNLRQITVFAMSYVFGAALWTWLVIQYRYFSPSLISQSSWVMANLWIFVVSGWASCLAVLLFVRRWSKQRSDGGKFSIGGK